VLLGLFSELNTPGGVQRAGRHIAAVMSEYAVGHKLECRLLSLNDSPELHRMMVGNREFVFTGSARGKARFSVAAAQAARRRATLIVAGHPFLAPVAQGAKLFARRAKSIVWAHGLEVWEPLSALRRRALRNADLIITPTKNTAAQIANQQEVPEERIRILPWALDPQFETLITSKKRPALPANFPAGRVILTVGRWCEDERYKGMDTLITALPRLLTEWPDVQLVAVGEGNDQGWLEQIAEGRGVQRHVHFLTGLSYSEIAACYEACEIFALPSRGEGFGLVYLEAMACGKPVIGGAHGGAPEVVEDGKTGYLVQHGDAGQLATSLETLLADPTLAQEMGASGRERVEREFRFNVFAKTLKKIFRELCES
jgi:phosphatidylinositol alpha-1,6-mannosyltransferase